ncbi:MAG: LacI family DNA-binding transcriptional regulator [Actinocatenispora sp.]
MATLAEVARQAGVSLATASRVLNGSTRVVRPELRDKVLAAATELRYTPNAHAQALAGNRTASVGLILHDVSDPYFAAIASGAMRRAGEQDLLVMMSCTFRDPERELAYVRMLHQQRAQAIILAGSGYHDRERTERLQNALGAYQAGGGRVAVVSQHRFDVDTVLPDNQGGARSLARALLDLGHRDFALITGPEHLLTVRDRYLGFRHELGRAAARLPNHRVVDGGFTRDGGYSAALSMAAKGVFTEVSCLVVLSDVMAIGALAALRDLKIRVPEDLSLAGFDDIPTVRDLVPPLTTVRLPLEEMGARAMELVLEPMPDRPLPTPVGGQLEIPAQATPPGARVVQVDAEVVLRDSTAELS